MLLEVDRVFIQFGIYINETNLETLSISFNVSHFFLTDYSPNKNACFSQKRL